jgi:hypothetical protein
MALWRISPHSPRAMRIAATDELGFRSEGARWWRYGPGTGSEPGSAPVPARCFVELGPEPQIPPVQAEGVRPHGSAGAPLRVPAQRAILAQDPAFFPGPADVPA